MNTENNEGPAKIAIVLDAWKYKAFKRVLTANGYTFKKAKHAQPKLITLKIDTYDIETLKAVVEKCQSEAYKNKHH